MMVILISEPQVDRDKLGWCTRIPLQGYQLEARPLVEELARVLADQGNAGVLAAVRLLVFRATFGTKLCL